MRWSQLLCLVRSRSLFSAPTNKSSAHAVAFVFTRVCLVCSDARQALREGAQGQSGGSRPCLGRAGGTHAAAPDAAANPASAPSRHSAAHLLQSASIVCMYCIVRADRNVQHRHSAPCLLTFIAVSVSLWRRPTAAASWALPKPRAFARRHDGSRGCRPFRPWRCKNDNLETQEGRPP